MNKILAILLMICVSPLVLAHEPMNHACIAPERPQDDQNDAQWNRFVADINTFRDCVNHKMEWHQSAAQTHSENAQQVVSLWNEFVRTSLNAPEDFPWPPED